MSPKAGTVGFVASTRLHAKCWKTWWRGRDSNPRPRHYERCYPHCAAVESQGIQAVTGSCGSGKSLKSAHFPAQSKPLFPCPVRPLLYMWCGRTRLHRFNTSRSRPSPHRRSPLRVLRQVRSARPVGDGRQARHGLPAREVAPPAYLLPLLFAALAYPLAHLRARQPGREGVAISKADAWRRAGEAAGFVNLLLIK